MAASRSIRRPGWLRRDGPTEVAFEAREDISERVIFSVTVSQSHGIEDAQFDALLGVMEPA